ncbi:hypothetical protein DOY81_011815 [Sarcophaga bullata]|nr:hypothetical protein DOY81_011815 [Sarcophaga bullata]
MSATAKEQVSQEVNNAASEEKKPIFRDIDADETPAEATEIESACMNCFRQGRRPTDYQLQISHFKRTKETDQLLGSMNKMREKSPRITFMKPITEGSWTLDEFCTVMCTVYNISQSVVTL